MGTILAFAVIMAFALLFNTMTVNVLEREREFATMRAVGTGRRTIGLLLSTESVVLWLLAAIPGLLAASGSPGRWAERSSRTSSRFSSCSATDLCGNGRRHSVTMILAAIPAIRRINRLNLAESTKMLS